MRIQQRCFGAVSCDLAAYLGLAAIRVARFRKCRNGRAVQRDIVAGFTVGVVTDYWLGGRQTRFMVEHRIVE